MLSKNILSKALNTTSSFLSAIYLSAIFSSPNLATNDIINEDILVQIPVKPSPFTQEYMKELDDLHAKKNIPADPSIEYVFVLSGRGSYLKNPVDGPDIKDREDDYNRIELGIKVAQDVTIARSGKSDISQEDIEKYGPIIIYNGRAKHNEDLNLALENGVLSHYPKDKFHIMAIKEESTRGQFKNLKEDFPISNTSVAIITHAYHFPRVARMIESKWNPFGENTKVFFYLVDRDLKAPGIIEDVQGEIERIPNYIRNGDLNASIPQDITF